MSFSYQIIYNIQHFPAQYSLDDRSIVSVYYFFRETVLK